jgi:6-phosphogluconolactonase
LRESLAVTPVAVEQIQAMPVESHYPEIAAAAYGGNLRQISGSPLVIDLLHLVLGADGHTASLVPGDPVLDVESADVVLTRPYQGRRRMTLTYPILNRARQILWVVTGSEKAGMVNQLLNGDHSIPAGRVRPSRARVLADRAAASFYLATPEGEAQCA